MLSKKQQDENYYKRLSIDAINSALAAAKDKPVELQIKDMMRAYPFGERKGRPYKIWNKLTTEAQIRLRKYGSLDPRKQ